ncbi:REJ domain-containing protein [Microbulbifer sp. THAF38]|uniref:PKD domain-containing protein n=1 Tax=Microbulbifer sp. THAF38 TaxID=2587856 RepID=UPI00126931E0|nr:REJ domain-containing protein [Microbulbifer sp. THAF38]QFT55407.1 REJ domain protein [Microbulbifer sp. THAF38]
MKRAMALWATLCMSLLFAACSSGGSESSEVEKPTASIGLLFPADSTFSLKDGPVTVQLNGTDSSSPRDASLTYRWELIEWPKLSLAELNGTEDAYTEFTAELPGDYVVSLIVDDGTASSEASRVTFTATSPYPVAITEPVHSVILGTDSLGLDGSLSTVPTGESGSLEFQWNIVDKPMESAAYLTNAVMSQATLHLDVEGDYKLELVVTYNGVDSEPSEVLVTVSAGDAPPVAVTEDQTITLGEEVVLDASESYDPEGNSLQYRWKWAYTPVETDGVPVPELEGETTSTVKFTPIAADTYNLILFVFDGARKSEEREVTIVVEADSEAEVNEAPIGEIEATGYYPSYSIGEQELGLRAEFNFIGYDPEGDALQIIDAELIEKPEGSIAELVDIGSWKPLGKKIQELDVVGTYRVSMTVSDGTNQIDLEATLEAKIGKVNGYPSTRSVEAQSKSVLVGDALVFDASSSDPNNDEMTFHWELVDKPDGSNAVIEPVTEPESGELRRAQVVTDVPGSYTARLIVSDDRGLYAKTYSEDDGLAKISNTSPEIRSVVWARNWGRLSTGEDHYQILPCMSLLHRPVVVDADGDEVFTYEELISAPEGGEFTSYPDSEDCENTTGTVFSKAGTYVFRYYATDLIDDAPEYDFVVKVEPLSAAKGVRLRNINSWNESLWLPMPYENIPSYGTPSDLRWDTSPTEEEYLQWSLTAVDADYTIENVQVKHINGGLTSLTPRFEGIVEGQVINAGESLDFKTWVPAVPCIRNDDKAEGFHFSFNIKEIPELTFTYETWVAVDDGMFSEGWRYCEAGELN